MIRYCDAYWGDVDTVLDCVPNLEDIQGRSIFITGGTGMLCSSVVDLLLRLNDCHDAGIRIILGGRSLDRVCLRFSGFQNEKDFSFIPYDVTGEQNLNIHADYIIHGASNANPDIYMKEPVETIRANIFGLDNLLSMGKRKKSKRLLYISSSEVYGNDNNIEDDQPYREGDYGFVDLLNPRAIYPCSKRAAESLCIAYSQEYGLDTVIVRPGHIYGPTITDTDSRASAQFTRNAAKGEDIVMKSAGQQLRSYCYTLDCASAILTVLLNGESGSAYNISNKNSVVTILDMANALAKASGRKVVYTNPSNQEKEGYNLMQNSSLNAEKLEKLGWRALFDLSEGAERTMLFYGENVDNFNSGL